jgi:WD40 repeat protein
MNAFSSIACNKVNQGLAIHPTKPEIMAYCAGNFLALYNSTTKKLTTRKAHINILTCIAFVSEEWLVTGSADNTVIVWRASGEDWVVSQVLRGHTAALTALGTMDASSFNNRNLLFVSADSSNTIMAWKVGEPTCMQSIPLGKDHSLALSLALFPGSYGALD